MSAGVSAASRTVPPADASLEAVRSSKAWVSASAWSQTGVRQKPMRGAADEREREVRVNRRGDVVLAAEFSGLFGVHRRAGRLCAGREFF